MDRELLISLGIDPDQDLKSLLEELEGKQYEFFERLETTHDDNRREELNGLLSGIDGQISLIKSQLAAAQSAIIFDAGVPEEDLAAQEQEQKKQREQEKKEAINTKVQAIKDKEAVRVQMEEAAAQEEAEEEKKAPAEPEVTQPAVPQTPTSDLHQAMVYYQKQNYSNAFPIFKHLAERNDATAQYMLACMYDRGEGTGCDRERAEFWMKKSADNGDAVAQFDYAIYQLSDQNRNNAKTALGIVYLKKSADQGHKDAMARFVELIQKGNGGLREIKAAQNYCVQLIAVTEDSYDKQTYGSIRQQLRTRQRKVARRNFGAKVSTVVSIAGALILLFATVAIFAGHHREFLETLPFISVCPENLRQFLYGFWPVNIADTSTITVLVMILVGWILKGAGNKYNYNTLAKVIVWIGCGVRYLAIGGHITICLITNTDVLRNADQLLYIAAPLVAGWILGMILGLILGTRAK